ncbi:hypothetical protein BURK1_00618 [Burkholderiales bacterium]|nr:hypothetical protein BURK1_00618 [Burkholderiales bacterium]
MSAEAYSFWLVPEAPVEREFGTLVRALAPLFGMPAFAPHATVQGDLDLSADEAESIARELVDGESPLAWRAWGIQWTEHPFRTFFVAFDRADRFHALLERAARLTGTREGLSPFPHLSLAYGSLPVREKIARSRPLAGAVEGRTIRFDRLVVALSGKEIPVGDWRVVATVNLGPDP